MKRTPLNKIPKKKCKENMLGISELSHRFESVCSYNCNECERPLFRSSLKRTPINKISKKKVAEIRNEKPIRQQLIERAKGKCEICGKAESQCFGGLHPHEKIMRSMGGKLSLENSIICCNTCHGNYGHRLNIKDS